MESRDVMLAWLPTVPRGMAKGEGDRSTVVNQNENPNERVLTMFFLPPSSTINSSHPGRLPTRPFASHNQIYRHATRRPGDFPGHPSPQAGHDVLGHPVQGHPNDLQEVHAVGKSTCHVPFAHLGSIKFKS